MATLTRDQVIEVLEGRGVRRDRAVQYADQYVAYHAATSNILEYGTIIKNPRTGQAVQNPYNKVRADALKALRAMQDIPTEGLW